MPSLLVEFSHDHSECSLGSLEHNSVWGYQDFQVGQQKETVRHSPQKKRRCPKRGLPATPCYQLTAWSFMGCSFINQLPVGYPHGYGNLHISVGESRPEVISMKSPPGLDGSSDLLGRNPGVIGISHRRFTDVRLFF